MLMYTGLWYLVYLANAVAYTAVLLLREPLWTTIGNIRSYPVVVILSLCALMGNVVVTDTCVDWLCILLAWATTSSAKPDMQDNAAATDVCRRDFLVVYCLKSGEPDDMKETLMFLKASWRMNTDYSDATYCVLSGTQKPELVAAEKAAIEDFNASSVGPTVRYVRRKRGVLHKYGQYLDFLMLLNGHKTVRLYKAFPTADGHVFEASSDVDFFCGSRFEYLVIMDRDNVLSSNFFARASAVLDDDTVQIVQPQIKPFPKNFRRALHGGESIYTSTAAKFQVIGNEVSDLKKRFVPIAPFFGKGVIRRSAYNAVLLEYDPATGSTNEDINIPRDLLSHDLIESSIMKTAYRSDIAIYEDFPLTHVEWNLRQGRWDLGDIVIAKYVYPLTFGMVPNFLSGWSYARAIRKYWSAGDRVAKYSSTFGIRAAFVKLWIVVAIVTAYFVKERVVPELAYALVAFVNAQMIVLPAFAVMLIVRGLSWRERLAVQLFTVYMGTCDIWFGAWRSARALLKILTGSNKWNTYASLGHSPFRTMLAYVGHVRLELASAAALAAAVLYDAIGLDSGFQTRQIMALAYLGLVMTFPAYAYVSSMKRGKFDIVERKAPITAVSSTNSIRSTRQTESEDTMLEIALAEILASIRMDTLVDMHQSAVAQARTLAEVKAQAFAKAKELELIVEDPGTVVVNCAAFEDEDYWVPGPNGMLRFTAA
jgi:Glycosyl transferase family group 2